MSRTFLRALAALTLTVASVGCSKDNAPAPTDDFGRCADFDPLRQVFWGDTHVHTELSFDANMQGTRTSPRRRLQVRAGRTHPAPAVQRRRYPDPDGCHRSAFGLRHVERPCGVPWHLEGLQRSSITRLRRGPVPASTALHRSSIPSESGLSRVFVGSTASPRSNLKDAHYPALCGPGDEYCLRSRNRTSGVGSSMMPNRRTTEATAAASRRLPDYEWSGGPKAKNLHRNVMFKNENVTRLSVQLLRRALRGRSLGTSSRRVHRRRHGLRRADHSSQQQSL